MKIKRRVFTVIVLFSLFIQQTMAVGLNDFIDTVHVSTSAGTWQSPRTGSRYFYGGSYTFAFKHPGEYQPFFQGEPPGVHIGCNGFSLSGGFMALLGIDEIKTMLKNAGATLAWGVMMGLEYSLPGIMHIFTTLRKWADEIQAILRNACNLGRIIASPVTGKINKTISNSFIGKTDQWMSNSFDGFTGKISKGIDNAYGDVTGKHCNGGLGAVAKKACEKLRGGVVKGEAHSIVVTSQNSFLSLAAGSHVKSAALASNTVSIGKLSTFLEKGKIGSHIIFSNSDQLNTFKARVLFSRMFFGDSATPSKTFGKLLMMSNDANLSAGDHSIDDNKIKNNLEAKLTKDITFPDAKGVGMLIPREITSSKSAAKALLYGIKSGSCVGYCHDGYIDIVDNNVYALDFSKGKDSHDTYRAIGNLLVDKDGTDNSSSNLQVKWNGAYLESLALIRYLVKQKTNYSPTFKAIGESSVTVKDTSSTDIKIPLLLPNISKYIQTIVLLEKKAKEETAYTAQLKSILAKYNAYFYSTSLMDMIAGYEVSAIGANGDAAGRPKVKTIRAYLQHILGIKNDILKMIKEDQKNQISYQQLIEMFEKIDRNIRTENMKNY